MWAMPGRWWVAGRFTWGAAIYAGILGNLDLIMLLINFKTMGKKKRFFPLLCVKPILVHVEEVKPYKRIQRKKWTSPFPLSYPWPAVPQKPPLLSVSRTFFVHTRASLSGRVHAHLLAVRCCTVLMDSPLINIPWDYIQWGVFFVVVFIILNSDCGS